MDSGSISTRQPAIYHLVGGEGVTLAMTPSWTRKGNIELCD